MRAGSKPAALNYADVKSTLLYLSSLDDVTRYMETNLHNNIHGAIGGVQKFTDVHIRGTRNYGHMTSLYSPYDPIFFLLHGFMDYLWKQWQDRYVDETNRMNRSHMMMALPRFDGPEVQWHAVSEVAMSMDIDDNNPNTAEVEKACVYYHERKTGDEGSLLLNEQAARDLQ